MLSKDAPREHAELVILSLLEAAPKYGYAISKEVAERSENQLRLTPGVLYPILKSLEADKLIASHWETVRSERNDGESDGRKRKWYSLTAKGRKRLRSQIEAHRAWRSLIDLFIDGTSPEVSS